MHEHEHSWDILDVQARPRPEVRLPMVSPVAATYVLVRCVHCGIPDALTVPGTWTLAQLRADAFADERQLFLTELGKMPVAELTALLAPYLARTGRVEERRPEELFDSDELAAGFVELVKPEPERATEPWGRLDEAPHSIRRWAQDSSHGEIVYAAGSLIS
jgi:hypothetical protein